MSVEPDLLELIEKCKAGDRRAQFDLYGRFSGLMFAVSLRYTNSKIDAEDVVQNAWVKIFTKLDTFSENNSFEASKQCDFTREELEKAISRMPEGYGVVFKLYVIDGYKHKEIAEMLGIEVNTSKSQLSRAKKFLQGVLCHMEQVAKPYVEDPE